MRKRGSIIKICALLFGLFTLSAMSNCERPGYGEQSGDGAGGAATDGSSDGGY